MLWRTQQAPNDRREVPELALRSFGQEAPPRLEPSEGTLCYCEGISQVLVEVALHPRHVRRLRVGHEQPVLEGYRPPPITQWPWSAPWLALWLRADFSRIFSSVREPGQPRHRSVKSPLWSTVAWMVIESGRPLEPLAVPLVVILGQRAPGRTDGDVGRVQNPHDLGHPQIRSKPWVTVFRYSPLGHCTYSGSMTLLRALHMSKLFFWHVETPRPKRFETKYKASADAKRHSPERQEKGMANREHT